MSTSIAKQKMLLRSVGGSVYVSIAEEDSVLGCGGRIVSMAGEEYYKECGGSSI
jgi:hypothetical protein